MLIPLDNNINLLNDFNLIKNNLIKNNINIISMDIPWDKHSQALLPQKNNIFLENCVADYQKISRKISENQANLDLGLVLINPIELDNHNYYKYKLNYEIAVALDALVIFITSNEDNKLALEIAKAEYGERSVGYCIEKTGTVEANNDSPLREHDRDSLPNTKIKRDETCINLTIDIKKIQAQLALKARITPPNFCYDLVQKAIKAKKRIVLPEGNEPRTIEAAAIAASRNIAECILLGDEAEIKKIAESKNILLNLDYLKIINPDKIRDNYIAPMVELRKSKGLTPEQAKEALLDNVVLGTMMLKLGEVDGLVSGAVHTTANTIRPALQLIKTKPNVSLVSSIFFMCLPDQVLIYGDCAVNPNPTAAELADIAIQSADSAIAFGFPARVALISYSTGVSGAGADVEKVAEALKIAKQKRPDLLIDGPLQYDAAIMPDVAKSKAPNSPVAGKATVFIFPDLNTGNALYKAVQRSANIICIGPMLQGLQKPVNDLSRGCLVEDIVFTIALTAVQAIK